MNMLAQIQNDNNTDQVTMTSPEIVDFINVHRQAVATIEKPYKELRHDHFMAKVPQVLGEKAAPIFLGTDIYTNGTGGTVQRQIYRFPKREACLMAMSYSYELQAQIFDRMTAMEEALKKPALNLDDPAFLRQALLGYTEKVIELEQQVQLQAPKVAFVDKYVAGNGNKTFRQVAKLLQIKEYKFREFLESNRIMYKLNGEWTAYQNHVDAKRFHVKTGVSDSGHAFNHSLFTPKGIEWIAGELAKFNLRGVA
ncbi:hypothetical protein F965_00468 [Acinetobacter schindleri NIPH 900]|uniref:Antirepressor protein C-terminal domain-containing protein n=1 Tax=Acinetobacter schindleri NIPH 900 TaxID=1217675 RepID=N8Y4I5_9GAMM|nr:phage antirepressor KilAC domain-containing protein [Acinetobacter schindleri]ENV14225.1 hypothetical protein F965_00468 [Acinetobacter schindleri NIPH 900]